MHRCPDDETLAGWFEGRLSVGQSDRLQREVADCPACARRVLEVEVAFEPDEATIARVVVPSAVTRRALDLWPTEPTKATGLAAVERMLRIAVRWVAGALEPLADELGPLEPLAVAVRGAGGPAEELRYELDMEGVRLTIDLEVEDADHLAVAVRLDPPGQGATLRLVSGGDTTALASLGATGATLRRVRAARYDLVIEAPGAPTRQLVLELVPAA